MVTVVLTLASHSQEGIKSKDDEDDEDTFDYEDRVFSVMKARGKRLDFHENANFDHEDPGLHEVCMLAVQTVNSQFLLISMFTTIPMCRQFYCYAVY